MAYNYPDLSYDDMHTAYKEAEKNSNKIRKITANYFNVSETSLRYRDYVNYCINKKNVDFVPYQFTGDAAKIFAGSLMIGNNSTIIGFNSTMNDGRCHFTQLHEINHLFNDVKEGATGESFPDLLQAEGYNPEEQYREAVANFGASMLLIPEEPMYKCILEGHDLEQGFSREFESSYSANFTRLRDYLIYICGATAYGAWSAIEEYKALYSNSRLYKHFQNNYEKYPYVKKAIDSVTLSNGAFADFAGIIW